MQAWRCTPEDSGQVHAKGSVYPLQNPRASKSATHGFASKSDTRHKNPHTQVCGFFNRLRAVKILSGQMLIKRGIGPFFTGQKSKLSRPPSHYTRKGFSSLPPALRRQVRFLYKRAKYKLLVIKSSKWFLQVFGDVRYTVS